MTGWLTRSSPSGGAIVSELGPDVVPSKGTFPRRNRIISGLADATVVVEAPARSGALITASWALEQGRDCYLVPGPIDAPASAGCLAFLREFRDATRIVAGIPQLIDDLGLADHLAEPGVTTQAAATLADVGEAAGRLGRELVLGLRTVDELVAVTGWPVASVLAGLTLLERRGLAVGVHGRFRPAGNLAGMDPAIARQRPRQRARAVPGTTVRGRDDAPPPSRAVHGLPGPSDRCYPSRGRSPPERAPDPALGGSPDHEQERLLRQATECAAGRPRCLAARLGALLRRSTLTRVGLALGLAFVLGVGVLGTGQPQTTVATRTEPILPLAQTAFTTTFSTDRGLSEPVTLAFTTPMDAASVAAALKVEPAKPVDLSWDATGKILTVTPRGRWSLGTFTHGDGPGGRSRRVRSAACPAGARRLPDPRRDDRLGHPDRARSGRASAWTRSSSCRSRSPSTSRRSGTRSGSTRRPPAPSARCIRRDGPTRYEFAPSAPLRSDVRYRLIVSGARDADGLPLDDVALAVRTVKAPAVVRFRPFAKSTDVARDAAISVRFTAGDGSAQHGPRVLGRRSAARPSPDRSAGPNRTPSWSSPRSRRCRTARRSR